MTDPTTRLVLDRPAVDALHEVMRRCAQALEDDTSCTFGSPKPGGGWNRRANSFEAGAALQEVAEILGIDGPDDIQCESSDG